MITCVSLSVETVQEFELRWEEERNQNMLFKCDHACVEETIIFLDF
jgi:hypothetical protein